MLPVVEEDNEDLSLIRDNHNNNNNQIPIEIEDEDINGDEDERGRMFTGDDAHLFGNGFQSLCFVSFYILMYIYM